MSSDRARYRLRPATEADLPGLYAVCLKTGGKPDCIVVTPDQKVVPLPQGDAASFFFANAGAKGYYRTSYTTPQFKAIVAKVETALSPQERIENRPVHGAHDAGRPHRLPGAIGHRRPGLVKVVVRAHRKIAADLRNGRMLQHGPWIGGGDAARQQQFPRQVKPVAGGIFGDIAQDIGELQSAAEMIGDDIGFGAIGAKGTHREPAHRAGVVGGTPGRRRLDGDDDGAVGGQLVRFLLAPVADRERERVDELRVLALQVFVRILREAVDYFVNYGELLDEEFAALRELFAEVREGVCALIKGRGVTASARPIDPTISSISWSLLDM